LAAQVRAETDRRNYTYLEALGGCFRAWVDGSNRAIAMRRVMQNWRECRLRLASILHRRT
jgi:hypothetical protein